MSKFSEPRSAIDAIEAFGYWLKQFEPGWNISRPAVEQLDTGEWHSIFVLYQAGVSIGVYKTPMEALARINDDDLTRKYLSVIAEPASLALRSADVGFMLRAGSIIRPEAPQEFLRYARRRRALCGEKRPGFPTAAG
jgi:hypothetical protein